MTKAPPTALNSGNGYITAETIVDISFNLIIFTYIHHQHAAITSFLRLTTQQLSAARSRLVVAPATACITFAFARRPFSSTAIMGKERVAIIGSGNWCVNCTSVYRLLLLMRFDVGDRRSPVSRGRTSRNTRTSSRRKSKSGSLKRRCAMSFV